MTAPPGPSPFLDALAEVGRHDHLCLIHETPEEQFAAVIPFLRLGLERGERCVYIADENSPATIVAALQGAGIDTRRAMESGALAILTAQQTFLRDGDPERMTSFLAETVAAAKAAGFAALRLTGEMTWALGKDRGGERLLEFAAKLTDFFAHQDIVAISQYNRRRFAPAAILGILRTHPRVIHGGRICRNPYFVATDDFFHPPPVARKVDRLLAGLATLAEREAAARDREALLTRILDASPAGILIVERGGRITFTNARAEAILGRRREELRERTYNDPGWRISDEAGRLVADADLPFRRVLETGQPLDDARLVIERGDGRRVSLAINAAPLCDAAGRVEQVIFALADITELRRAEAALREAQRLAHIGSWDWDADTDSIIWSDEYYRLYHLDPSRPTPNYLEHLQAYTPESAHRLDAAVTRALQHGTPYELELEVNTPDTARQWVLARGEAKRAADGRITGLRGTAQDITARKHTEAELAKLHSAIEQSPVSILITDAQGVIEYVNPKFTQLTGYTPEEARGHTPRIMKSGYTSDEEYRQLWSTIGAGRIWEGTFRNRKKNGELFWEHATIAPVKSAQGEISHYIAIKEDITARRQLEDQLRQAQKMEAVGQLAGGIAHDFNNILTAIIGYTTLLDMKMAGDDPLRVNLHQTLAAANRAAELTRSLLAFSRKQTIALQPVDLNQSIRSMDEFLRRVIGADIELQTVLGERPLIAVIDRGQFDQVLVNLATNARDAMPGGGAVTIATRSLEIDADFVGSHGFGQPGAYALVTCADTGSGMDEATRQQVFEPFFTTKGLGQGTGLGLSMVYGMVKQHHGYITVASAPERGTTLSIYLPLAPEEAASQALPARAETGVRGGNEVILVADVDALVRSLAEQTLRQFGYTVISAADGDEALARFREEQDRVDLVILDLVMPKRNGKEVFEAIRKLRPDLKVLFTSGYAADVIQRQQALDPTQEFIQKPMAPQVLLAKVREALDRMPAAAGRSVDD